MTVRDLQTRLAKLDPDLEVLCSTEDAAHLAQNHGFRLFDIVDFTVTEAEKNRAADQVPLR